MSKPRITVTGQASRWAPADFVEVGFSVVRRSADSDQAVAGAAEAYRALDAVLEADTGAVVRRTTTSVRVQEITRYEPDTGRHLHEGFEATRSETVRFAPVDRAGPALGAVLDAVPDLFVAGLEFGLDPDNPVHAAVRTAATAAARSSAEAYASGVGLSLGPVVELREPNAGAGGPRGFELAMAARAKVPDDEGGTVLAGLSREDVEVTAGIELVVTLVS